MTPTQSAEETTDELPSPPRIKRLPNRRRRKKKNSEEGRDDGDSDSDSDSDVYFIQFPLATPPRSPSGTSCDIAEFRRRLDVVKERRARNSASRSTPQSSIIESPCFHCPNTSGLSCHSLMLEDPYQEDSPTEKQPLSPMKDSPVSTCQTFDEITLDTTLDSNNLVQSNSPEYRVAPLPSSSGRKTTRKVKCPGNDFLNLRRFMCSSDRNIDTSFAQITDAICKPKTPNEVRQHRSKSKKSKARYTNVGAGEFPLASNTPGNIPANGLLDRLFCTRSASPALKRSQPKSSKKNVDHELSGFHGDFPIYGKDSSNQRQIGTQQLAACQGTKEKQSEAINPEEMLRPEHQISIDEMDRIRPKSSQGTSSFSWMRKDPWYLRPSDCGEDGEEIVVIDDENHDSEVLDRLMHAVFFVEENEI